MERHRGASRRASTTTGRWPRAAGLVATVAVGIALVGGCATADDAGDGRGAVPATSGTSSTSGTSAPSQAPSGTGAAPVAGDGAVVVAHRGASGYAPEHTFAAYDLAIEQGADYIEQDLQLTADGVLVVLHDATLDRTARGPAGSCTGPVAEKTLAQIEECEVGSWFNEAHPERADPAFVGLRIPTMEQVLDRYGADVRYYIEIKALDAGSGMEEPLLDLLADAGLLEPVEGARPVLVQSFGAEVLRTVHARRPDLPLVLLLPNTGAPVDPAVIDSAPAYAVAIGPPAASTDEALVAVAHERCLDVHPYTVDDPIEMDRLLSAGVDGMFTNEPDVLRSTVDGRAPLPERCSPPGT